MYNTLQITPVIATISIIIFLSTIPKNITISPTKLQVPGNPILAKQNKTNKTENIGTGLTKPP